MSIRSVTAIVIVAAISAALAGCDRPKPQPAAKPPVVVAKPHFAEFEPGKVRGVASISALVNPGEIAYAPGPKPDSFEIATNGSVSPVNNVACMACFETLKIAANLRVPTTEFQAHDIMSAPKADERVVHEYIVAGPAGATLKKVGGGYELVAGAAHIEPVKH